MAYVVVEGKTPRQVPPINQKRLKEGGELTSTSQCIFGVLVLISLISTTNIVD